MKTKTALAAIIAAIIVTPSLATITAADRKITTSKGYVDTGLATKQGTIPATGTNSNTPGDTVVTYTSTEGTIGERGIYSDGSSVPDSLNDLVTAGALGDILGNIPTVETSKLTCADQDCTLLTVSDVNAYGDGEQSQSEPVIIHRPQVGDACSTVADCAGINCGDQHLFCWDSPQGNHCECHDLQ